MTPPLGGRRRDRKTLASVMPLPDRAALLKRILEIKAQFTQVIEDRDRAKKLFTYA